MSRERKYSQLDLISFGIFVKKNYSNKIYHNFNQWTQEKEKKKSEKYWNKNKKEEK